MFDFTSGQAGPAGPVGPSVFPTSWSGRTSNGYPHQIPLVDRHGGYHLSTIYTRIYDNKKSSSELSIWINQ